MSVVNIYSKKDPDFIRGYARAFEHAHSISYLEDDDIILDIEICARNLYAVAKLTRTEENICISEGYSKGAIFIKRKILNGYDESEGTADNVIQLKQSG